ncbi:hypothetical protein BIY22_02260 [Vibrio panuliri]|uniref:Uncharacterized protein n=1 Tax=Vibrio panuliri TaxID=1381081 RepID=A0A1Q9HR79_9VIBR|nr:hypothetical protein [Vibrio panuliri]OLQ93335.1 hypothetical protein BIY22_02260 [Vibrio panuliri]
MKKRLLPIPLILLVPIVLLVIVVVAGLYRFSIDDEEILAKFPNQHQQYDVVVKQIFDIQTPNPWTIEVPESAAFAYIDQVDPARQVVLGAYDSGVERGQVSVSTQWLTFVDTNQYVSVMTVSNQGSGVFTYLATFNYDVQRKRMVLVDSVLIGDRVVVDDLSYDAAQVTLSYRFHGDNHAMADEPNQHKTQLVTVNPDLTLLLHNK